MPIGEFMTFLAGFKTVMEIVEKIKGALPDSPEKEELTKQLAEAQKAAAVAEAQAAQSLGYQLCRCTWPPQIMLQVGGWNVDEGTPYYQCQKCNYEWPRPSTEEFDPLF